MSERYQLSKVMLPSGPGIHDMATDSLLGSEQILIELNVLAAQVATLRNACQHALKKVPIGSTAEHALVNALAETEPTP